MIQSRTTWNQARKAPFEASGVLYYPVFRSHADLPTTVDDADMAWAVTANANLEGTGYTLSQPSIITLAAYHHTVVKLAQGASFLPLAAFAEADLINPLADITRLVPDVTASPMYPDFPTQVMQISEAQFRYDQACHYFSTYGVEALAGLLGLDVTVGKGWLPNVEATPKTQADETLVAPKVLHLLVTVEDLQAVVAARLTRATRMHPAEIATALLVFQELGENDTLAFPKVAFHENMMELIRVAAQEDSGTLERVATGLAQHPGDLLKAVLYVMQTNEHHRLTTRQKKGFCRAFERFGAQSIAHNIADAGHSARLAPNYLSVARFAGPHLREAVELVEAGKVRSWAGELELRWQAVDVLYGSYSWQSLRDQLAHEHAARNLLSGNLKAIEDAWRALLTHYGTRPGMLLRALSRLAKGGCPGYLLIAEMNAHADVFSLPTLVSTATALSVDVSVEGALKGQAVVRSAKRGASHQPLDAATRAEIVAMLRPLIELRLRGLDTPLKGRRVYLDTAGISLVGSLLRPNEVGDTGTAWPPAGIAFDLPADKTLRFFTFWDDRKRRVDVDLHFMGRTVSGKPIHVGWNARFRTSSMVTSVDITTSHDSVEYLDIDMDAARKEGIAWMVQKQHIYAGRSNWGDIQTCYSGALLVKRKGNHVRLYSGKNLLFRDDLTGPGSTMDYASINVPDHYVRIVRGADIPLGSVGYALGDYLDTLFRAQEVTLVDTPEEAELQVCVGRSADPEVVSLFDEGFYLR